MPAGGLDSVIDATADAVRNVAADLARGAGWELASVDLGGFFTGDVVELFARIQAREVWATHGLWLAENMDYLATDVRDRVRRAEERSGDPAAVKASDAGSGVRSPRR